MNKKIEQLKLKAASLTRQTHDLGIPVMIVYLPQERRVYPMNYYLRLMLNTHSLYQQKHQMLKT